MTIQSGCTPPKQPSSSASTTTWQAPAHARIPPLKKRKSSTELRPELGNASGGLGCDGLKRWKAASITAPVIVISDDEDNDHHSKDAVGHPPPNPLETATSAMQTGQSPPLDHMGRPLSDAALAVAREYWDCQRQLDSCPFDDDDLKGPDLPVDLLMLIACHRRSYTRLVFGKDKLEPGSRTFEPPYVEPQLQTLRAVPEQSHEPSAQPAATPLTAPQAETRTEPVLCPEQAELVELAASGRNIFYTGSAGCGKSTVLHAIRKRLQGMGKTVRVMAPTGKVALAINGTTTWTFAGWTPDHHKRELEDLKKLAWGKNARKRFRQTDTIIIDEISMVENLHLERLNVVMKEGRSKHGFPFGGVQVIVTGDFCQLPPVKPFQHCIDCGSDLVSRHEEEDTVHTCPTCGRSFLDADKWAFRSNAWKECNFVHIHLKSIHRQSDGQFISMLQKCRLGIPFTPEEVDILMNHRSVTANAVKLFSTRDEVRRTNEEAFARLKTPPHPYRCFDRFIWHAERHPHLQSKSRQNPDGSLRALDDHRFERRMELKKGMLVVLLVNLDLPAGLCNGSQGIIAGFEEYDPKKLPRKADTTTTTANTNNPSARLLAGEHASLRESHIQQFAAQQLQDRGPSSQEENKLFWPAVRFLNGATRVIYPECQVHELGDGGQPYSLLCRTQVPLAAAWALSIHKSQGMTLDRVVVDLSRAFEEGQVYVALSRATSLAGLKVDGDPQGLAVGMGGNEQVRAFLRERFGM